MCPRSTDVRHGESVDRISAQSVTGDFFSTLGVSPMIGRTFNESDFNAGSLKALVLSHAYWVKEFGGRPEVVGSRVIVDGQPGQVVGVMPRNFRSFFVGREARAWLAINGRPEQLDRSAPYVEVLARPKPGVTMEQVKAEMSVVGGRLAAQYPAVNSGRGITVRTIREIWMGRVGMGPRIIGASVFFRSSHRMR